jgi:hypothetical protein
MILGIEIALTVMGILLLIRGKGLGKDAAAHPHYRLLGGFMLTVLPFVILGGIVFGFVWALTHSDQSLPELEKSMKWPLTGLEFLVVITYAVIAHFWEKAIKRKAAAPRVHV